MDINYYTILFSKVPDEGIYNKPIVDLTHQCRQDEAIYPVQGQKSKNDQNDHKNKQVTERKIRNKSKITVMLVTTLLLVVLSFSILSTKVLFLDKHKTITG